MNEDFDTFTVDAGIGIQNRDLERWQQVLKPEVYDLLAKWARETNHRAQDGYDVRRGMDLTEWVCNYRRNL